MLRKSRTQQLTLALPTAHGGHRRGAGRKNLTGTPSHVARERLNGRVPVHVTLRVAKGLSSLRKKLAFACWRQAVRKARGQGLAIRHFALLSNHVHLILEPGAEPQAMGRAIQSLTISFAKLLNAKLGRRRGSVFQGRYHAHPLRTPTEVRNALAYVLSNEALHIRRAVSSKSTLYSTPHSTSPSKLRMMRDPYSSAAMFTDWRKLWPAGRLDWQLTAWSDVYLENWWAECLSPPQTWLLREGWKRA